MLRASVYLMFIPVLLRDITMIYSSDLNSITAKSITEKQNAYHKLIKHVTGKVIPKTSSNFFNNKYDLKTSYEDVLVELLKVLQRKRNCQLLVYFDDDTVSTEQLRLFDKSINATAIFIDAKTIKFPLLTLSTMKKKPLLVKLLGHRDNSSKCRFILAWTSLQYQKGLLVMAKTEQSILSADEDTVIFPTTDKYLARFIPEIRNRILVRKVYNTGRGSKLRRASAPERFVVEQPCEWCKAYTLLQIGEFRNPGGWVNISSWQTHNELRNAHLQVTYTNSIPNSFIVEGGKGPRLEGLEIRMLEYVSQSLGFTYSLFEPSDGEWGLRINGSWTGKIREIVEKKADLAIGGIVYTSERATDVKYSSFFHYELWGIVCLAPARLPLWPYLIFPFRGESAAMAFYLLIMLHILAYFIAAFVDDRRHRHNNSEDGSLSDSVNRVFRAGLSLYLRFIAILYFWNLFYCLIKPTFEESVNSVDDLLMSGRSWGILSGTTVENFLLSSNDTSFRTLAKSAYYLGSIEEGWERMKSSDMCLVGVPKRFATSSATTKYTTECGESAIHISSETLNTVLGGWITPYGSILSKHIDHIIGTMETFGLIDKWRKDIFEMLSTNSEKIPCLIKPIGPLSISDMRLAFVTLVIGWCVAILTFLFEHAFVYFTVNNDTDETFEKGARAKIGKFIKSIVYDMPTSQCLAFKEYRSKMHLEQLLNNTYGMGPS